MKFKAAIYVIVFVLCIYSAFANPWVTDSFNDSSTNGFLTLDLNSIKYIPASSTGIIYKAKIELDNANLDTLFQDDTLSFDYAGYNENVTSSVNNLDNSYWNYELMPCAGRQDCYYWYNFTDITNTTGVNFKWVRQFGGPYVTEIQKPINASCKIDPIQIYMFQDGNPSNSFDNTLTLYCYNGSEFIQFYQEKPYLPFYYETGLNFTTDLVNVTNVSIKINNTEVYSYIGVFPTVATEVELNISTCENTYPCEINFSNIIDGAKLHFDNLMVFSRNYTASAPNVSQIGATALFEINFSYSDEFFSSYNCTVNINGTEYEMIKYDMTNYIKCQYLHTFSEAGDQNSYFTYYYDGEGFNTTTYNTTIYGVEIGICNDTLNYTVVNLSYYDENSDQAVNLTNAFNISFYDGSTIQNIAGIFTDNYSNTFCTELNPADLSFNWNMYGSLMLSKDQYITRIINIDSGAPIVVSNDPITNQSLYIIGISNSSTMTYTWLTTTFNLIDGTMRIYKCNDDGSKDLVESTPIISGIATANIELLTQAYSYDVVIDGVIYEGGFTGCHIESTTAQTYYVETTGITVTDLVGLSGIPCDINQITDTKYTFTWGANPEDDSFVSACIQVYNTSGSGNTLLLEDCTTYTQFLYDGYTHTFTISDYGDMAIYGKLVQGDNYYMCLDTYSVYTPSEAADNFSFSGLLGLFLLVVAMALFFANDGEMQLLGAGIGLIGGFFLALSKFSWLTTASALLFLGLIYLVGRHSRVKS